MVELQCDRGQRGEYSCEDLGGGDILVGREAEPAVACMRDYGGEAGKAAKIVWMVRP